MITLMLFLVFDFRGIAIIEGYHIIEGAHRGSSISYGENTIPAFKAAIADPSYKFIEFDIQYSKDKKIVVAHDYSLFRLHAYPVFISDMDYIDLERFDIPLYNDVMDLISNKKPVNIEIKPSVDEVILAEEVIKDLKKRGLINNVMISSISEDLIKYLSKNRPEIKTGIIYMVTPATYIPDDEVIDEFYTNVEATGADYLMLHGTNLKNEDLLIKKKSADITLAFWYFSDKIFILKKGNMGKLW